MRKSFKNIRDCLLKRNKPKIPTVDPVFKITNNTGNTVKMIIYNFQFRDSYTTVVQWSSGGGVYSNPLKNSETLILDSTNMDYSYFKPDVYIRQLNSVMYKVGDHFYDNVCSGQNVTLDIDKDEKCEGMS